jgi:proteic killer suppression protein
MIKTFKNADTQNLFEGKRIRRWVNIESVALRKLAMLNRAACLISPGNRLERLKGDRANYYSIRINDQFRICFRFEQGEAFEVEIVDYH